MTHLRTLTYLLVLTSRDDLLLTVTAQGFNFPDSPGPVPAPSGDDTMSLGVEGILNYAVLVDITRLKQKKQNKFRKARHNPTRFSNITSIDPNHPNGHYRHTYTGYCEYWPDLHLRSNRNVHHDGYWKWWWFRNYRHSYRKYGTWMGNYCVSQLILFDWTSILSFYRCSSKHRVWGPRVLQQHQL